MAPDADLWSSYFARSQDTKQPFQLTGGKLHFVEILRFQSLIWIPHWNENEHFLHAFAWTEFLFKCCNLARDVCVLNPQQWVDCYGWGTGDSSSRPALFESRESFSQNGSLNLACVEISEQGTRQQNMEKPAHLFSTFWMKTSSIKCFTFSEMKFTLNSCSN